MKFYIYKKNLLHKCIQETYDNLYTVNKTHIHCILCNKSAPVSVILGFDISEHNPYTIIGEESIYINKENTEIIKILKSLKSFET